MVKVLPGSLIVMPKLSQYHSTFNTIKYKQEVFTFRVFIIYTIRPDHIAKHLGPDADVRVDVLAGQEFVIPRNGIIETFQVLVEPLMIILPHRMVDRSKEYIDPPSAPLVVRVCFLVGAVIEAEGDTDHPGCKVGVFSKDVWWR